MFSPIDRSRGHAFLLLAAAGLMSSVPVRADTPEPAIALDRVILQGNTDVLVAELAPETAEPAGEGEASYYGRELAGNRTASGERFDPAGLTAAHRTLPLGSKLRVTNKANGKSVVVRINDRGPFTHNRIIDVSLGAARRIAMVGAGKAMVRLELLR